MSKKRVLSVGQCGADHQGISLMLRQHFEADVHPVDNIEDAMEHLRTTPVDLVLVNRVFDADGTSGMELIKQIRADNTLPAIPVMLVSNYEDAQRDAVAAGAVPGFGKAALGQPAMLSVVRRHLG